MIARHPGTTTPLCPLLDQEDASPSRDPCARGRGLGELLFGPLDDVKVVTKGGSTHGRHHFGLEPRLPG